jgi:hypothetical protein
VLDSILTGCWGEKLHEIVAECGGIPFADVFGGVVCPAGSRSD